MINITSGVLDKTRMVSNILMLVLVAGNIFFSIQYTENIKSKAELDALAQDNTGIRIQAARVLNFFINTVLNTENKTISFDDRVKLENDVRQLLDPNLTAQWTAFVNSKDSKSAQTNAIKVMSMLTGKMIQ